LYLRIKSDQTTEKWSKTPKLSQFYEKSLKWPTWLLIGHLGEIGNFVGTVHTDSRIDEMAISVLQVHLLASLRLQSGKASVLRKQVSCAGFVWETPPKKSSMILRILLRALLCRNGIVIGY
jgi:hypothetical protein